MNPEILKKCLSGEASDAEWDLYQDWLRGAAEEMEEDIFVMQNHVMVTEAEVKQRIWKQLSKSNQKQDLFNRRKEWLMYSSAAITCIILSILFFVPGGYPLNANHAMVFSHRNSRSFRAQNFEGLQFKLAAESNVRLENQSNNQVKIEFNGNMMLKNTTLHDKQTEVLYTETNGRQISKKLLLRKGRTYLFAFYPFQDDKLVVIENRNLIDMPPVLALNLQNDFD